MRLHILSDLHLEFSSFTPPQVDCDVVILAGDTHPGKKGLQWAIDSFPGTPVIYILGNHEYYRQAIPDHIQKLKSIAAGSNVHVLENDAFSLGDTVFLGCTLWSDFKLLGNPRMAGYFATENMNDYKKIRVSPTYRKLRSIDTAGMHNRSVDWLTCQLEQFCGSKIVVVTHHAPSPRSLPDGYEADILTAAAASRLDNLVESSGAALWIHGHLHVHQDYYIGTTRVIGNPRGYDDIGITGFIPGLLLEV